MAEDIKENKMNSGVPVKMKGIDTEGNSITPTMKEIADAPAGTLQSDVAHVEYGCFSNLRQISYEGAFILLLMYW